ncbi:MAG: hypothetical protein H0U65_02760 [Rubrobacter sp.]|jgi:hypothetical protein|nr:hypothetical protein [Rubrobacter sp.]
MPETLIMALFENKNSKPYDTPFPAPKSEGPDEISARTERAKSGKAAVAKRKLLDSPDETSTGRKFLVGAIPTAQTALIAAGFFTELPAEWLLGAAVPLLAHKDDEKAPNPEKASPPLT